MLAIKDWDFAWQDRYYFQNLVPLPKGTRLDVEIHWDNSADNPRNPSRPPVRVKWGEESRDEMGSVSLIAVPRQQGDFSALQTDIAGHRNEVMRNAFRTNPEIARKLKEILSE